MKKDMKTKGKLKKEKNPNQKTSHGKQIHQRMIDNQ